jgi:hypothetical protein
MTQATRTDSIWFAVGRPGQTRLRCAACGKEFDLGHMPADHHPGVCPVCGIESVFLDWHRRPVQIVMGAAPPALVRVLRLCQDHLDELEFTELLCALEDLEGGVKSVA